jgi:hypothetical protein
MVTNIRTDLGADIPVVVGEIANFLNGKVSDKHNAFVQMQKTFAAVTDENGALISCIAGVSVDATSRYAADANGIFTDPAGVVATGERVIAKLIKNGATSLAPETEIIVPEIKSVAELVFTDAEGNVVTINETSFAMAAAKAPSGATITIADDQTIYDAIDLSNMDNVTINGNGKTITVNTNEVGLALNNANVTLKNFKMVHNGDVAAMTVDTSSSVVIDGDSSIVAKYTAIELNGLGADLTIKNGTFKTTEKNSDTDAIIRTTTAHVVIEGGTFEAAAGTSCIYIAKNASNKLVVNIKEGTFIAPDLVTTQMTADNLVVTDSEGNPVTTTIESVAFVNECLLAIMVISPDVSVEASIHSVNMGLGAQPITPAP